MLSVTKERKETTLDRKGQKSKPRQPWYVLLGKIIAWQIAAIFLVELSLSLAGLGEEEIFKLDPDLGFRHMSNKKITWRSEGFATSYFDEHGLREPGLTVAKPAGVYRVALLGDSLAESLQVPVEESFGQQIQQQVSQQLQRPVQVIDFGTSGYSTVQEYLQLKKQVLAYKPDLVLLCYNSRDCFENWSPPDEVLTNVRPCALHLPGRQLVVDTSPVTQWMKTPRARFLKQVDFFRQNSRLWGIYSAAELDWSLHSEAYRRLIFFVTKPGKATRKFSQEISDWSKSLLKKPIANGARTAPTPVVTSVAATASTPSVIASTPGNMSSPSGIKRKTASSPGAAAKAAPANTISSAALVTAKTSPANTTSAGPVAANASLANMPSVAARGNSNTVASKRSEEPGRMTYQQLIVRTLGSLLGEMKSTCNSAGAQFAVVALPVRSALSVRKGMETAFNNFDFNDEVSMLKEKCAEKNIDFFNVHEQAKALSAHDKDGLFFLVHLTPEGHEFVSLKLTPVIRNFVRKSDSNINKFKSQTKGSTND